MPRPDLIWLALVVLTLLLVQPAASRAAASCPADMVAIPAGRFRIGAAGQLGEERAAAGVRLSPFCLGAHEVTNRQFAAFVAATGYRTVAERPLHGRAVPRSLPRRAQAGFPGVRARGGGWPDRGTQLVALGSRCRLAPPAGAGQFDRRPATTIPSCRSPSTDAEAYAAWAGAALPSEAQWEFAARGGLKDQVFSWGDTWKPGLANTWQGEFPACDAGEDGYRRHRSGGLLPGQRLRPVRHDRQRLGVDGGLVPPGPRSAWPSGTDPVFGSEAAERGSPRSGRGQARDQGRLLPVLPHLLQPLPPRRPGGPEPRHRHLPHRLPPRFPAPPPPMAKRPFRATITSPRPAGAWWCLLVGWQLGGVPALAQRITGTPGAPNATTTIPGNQLPAPAPPFGGVIKDGALQSKPWWAPRIVPPQQAPNVLLIITDDAGFGVPSTFGGVIPTPAMDRVAKAGLRYNRMFSTALCSPTRAALITGRNHHSAGFGVISEQSTGFPGYNSIIERDKATIGRLLKDNGYSTAWFGKDHNVPAFQASQSGPFDQWPTGMGFEYFYGFVGGDANQWQPNLFRNTTQIYPFEGKAPGSWNLVTAMADDAIDYMSADAPDQPRQAAVHQVRPRRHPCAPPPHQGVGGQDPRHASV